MKANPETVIAVFNSWVTFLVLIAVGFVVVHYGSKLNYPARKSSGRSKK